MSRVRLSVDDRSLARPGHQGHFSSRRPREFGSVRQGYAAMTMRLGTVLRLRLPRLSQFLQKGADAEVALEILIDI